MSYAWARAGERTVIPYENPQGRRWNALALQIADGPDAALDWMATHRHFRAADLVHFLTARPAATRPLVVVLDNAAFHRSHVIREALPDLWAKRIHLYYLPPYSPKLNAIEHTFRTIKHLDLPERTYPTLAALEAAVDRAFQRREHRIKTAIHPRLAA